MYAGPSHSARLVLAISKWLMPIYYLYSNLRVLFFPNVPQGVPNKLLLLLCRVVSCCVVLHYAVLCCVVLCYVMLCYVMLCYAMLYYTMLCYSVLYYGLT